MVSRGAVAGGWNTGKEGARASVASRAARHGHRMGAQREKSWPAAQTAPHERSIHDHLCFARPVPRSAMERADDGPDAAGGAKDLHVVTADADQDRKAMVQKILLVVSGEPR